MGITLSVSSQTGLNFNQKTVLHEAGLKNTVSRLMVSAGEWLQSFPWISLYSLGWRIGVPPFVLCFTSSAGCTAQPLFLVPGPLLESTVTAGELGQKKAICSVPSYLSIAMPCSFPAHQLEVILVSTHAHARLIRSL